MSTIYNSLTNFGRVRYGKSYFWPTSGAIIRNLEPYYGQTLLRFNPDLEIVVFHRMGSLSRRIAGRWNAYNFFIVSENRSIWVWNTIGITLCLLSPIVNNIKGHQKERGQAVSERDSISLMEKISAWNTNYLKSVDLIKD